MSLNRFIDDNIMPFFNGNKDGSSSDSDFDYRPSSNLMTWTQLNDRLLAVETPSERTDYNLKLAGKGRANAKATLRLFAEAEGYEPEIVLYRDTAGNVQLLSYLSSIHSYIPYPSMVPLLREGVAVSGGEADPLPRRKGSAKMLWREAEELLPVEPQRRTACGCDKR
jgi:hypothetical protein